jgi:hypothetical protein
LARHGSSISINIDIDKYRYVSQTSGTSHHRRKGLDVIDRNVAGWMIAGGFRYADPTANLHAEHLAALRMTDAGSAPSSQPNELVARLLAAIRPSTAAAATNPGSLVTLDPACCAA